MGYFRAFSFALLNRSDNAKSNCKKPIAITKIRDIIYNRTHRSDMFRVRYLYES